MMSSVEPGFKVSEHLVDVGESLVRALRLSHDPNVVDELFKSRVRVSPPAIGSDPTLGLHIFCQKSSQTLLGSVRDQGEPEPARALAPLAGLVLIDEYLDSAHDQALVPSPASSRAFFGSSNECLVGFDQSGNLGAGVAHHAFAETMEKVPGGVMALETQLPLKLERADPRRESGHMIGRREPVLKWNFGTMQGSPRHGRRLIATAAALDQRTSLDSSASFT
jgi:hypothetical protein